MQWDSSFSVCILGKSLEKGVAILKQMEAAGRGERILEGVAWQHWQLARQWVVAVMCTGVWKKAK